MQFGAAVEAIGKRREVCSDFVVVVIDTADDLDDEADGDQQADDEVPRAAVGEVAQPAGAGQGGPRGDGHRTDKAVAGKAGKGERKMMIPIRSL